jgi:hypothetical protein
MRPLRSSYPVGHLLNAQTRYVPAYRTDIRETFARVQRELDESYDDQCDPLDPSTWPSDKWDKDI